MGSVVDNVYNVALVAALWATAIGLGLSSEISGFLAPIHAPALLVRLIALDVVVLPLFVWTLTRLLGVPTDFAIGLILVGIASAGPLGIIATRIAGGDAAAAASFVVVLETANAVAIPVWVALLLPRDVDVPQRRVIVSLILLVLVPLAVGIALRLWRRNRVEPWPRRLAILSNVLVCLVVLLLLIKNRSEVRSAFGHGVAVIASVTVGGALMLGWILGGPQRTTRIAVAFVSAVRANALALAIAQASFPARQDVQAAVVTFGVFSIVVPLSAAFAVARRHDLLPPGRAR